MDFINKTLAQVMELFKTLTPAARVMAGLLAALVVISLAYLLQSQTSGPDAYLMGGEPFSASQLPAMEAAFSKMGLNGYVIEGARVRVPQGQQAAYMGALADANALPPSFGAYLGKAVGSTSPWISKEQQRELIKVAKQNELQDIIAAMKGIERASVLYDVQEQRSFGGQTLFTASVSVKPVGNLPLDEERVPTLRYLVASAIAGLKPESVTIIDLNGKHYPGGSGAVGVSGSASGENVYGAWKKAYEQEWQNKIRYALAYIPGVVVTPNVELDIETAHEENVTSYDAKTVVYSQKENTANKTIKGGGGPGGRPGVVAQQGTQANQPASISQSSGPESVEETSETQTNTAVPGKVVRTVHHGLTPKRVTVSVSVPSTYYERVWAERNPTPEGQPPKKPDAQALNDIETKVKTDIEGAVVALLPPVPATTDPFPRVKVSTFQPVVSAPSAEPTLADKALGWFSRYWTTLGMVGVAVASLLMLRSIIRSLPSAASAPAPSAIDSGPTLSLVAGDESAPQSGESNSARNRLKRRGSATGPSLRDELAEIVKEDPDTAVAILRNWIGATG